jgi:hypothetical protein
MYLDLADIRYFCKRLLGFSGIVISIKPALRAEFNSLTWGVTWGLTWGVDSVTPNFYADKAD